MIINESTSPPLVLSVLIGTLVLLGGWLLWQSRTGRANHRDAETLFGIGVLTFGVYWFLEHFARRDVGVISVVSVIFMLAGVWRLRRRTRAGRP